MQTIKVTQTASKKVLPDTVVFDIRLTGENKKHEEASAQLRVQADRCRALLQKAGVREEELTANCACVRAVRQDGKRAYIAQADWKARLPSADERVALISDALDESGVQWDMQWQRELDGGDKELLAQAVRQSREAAERIASAAGGRITSLVSAQYESLPHGNVMLMRASRTETAPVPEPVEVSETVTCIWEMH